MNEVTTAYKLMLDNMLVGILYREDNFWVFEYSEQFKRQTKYRPIANFSNKEKKYVSKELFPFFTTRLPGKGQLKLKKEDNCDIDTLLKKYGTHSATNPFALLFVVGLTIFSIHNILKVK
ncbi:MAG: HipA N-terminal domain-containing protein [Salinivirgaceae bacterium]|nr:HipA N-terminal domain-containing protein [Salinivirgaceae bacterium]